LDFIEKWAALSSSIQLAKGGPVSMGCEERRIKDEAQAKIARKKDVGPDSWIECSESRSWRDPQSTQNQSGTASLTIIDETPNAERLDLDLAAIGFKSNLSLSVIPIPNTVPYYSHGSRS
jgi:hypothetical protein